MRDGGLGKFFKTSKNRHLDNKHKKILWGLWDALRHVKESTYSR